MIRLRELGIEASSDNISDVERAFLDVEAKQLLQEGDRIAATTTFGTKKLLDGSGEQLEFHVGAFAGPENIIKYNLNADARSSTLGYYGISLINKDSARESLQKVDDSLTRIGKLRADFGSVQSRLTATVANLDTQVENLSAGNARLRDADIAHETAEVAQSSVLQNAAISVLAQANQTNNMALKLLA